MFSLSTWNHFRTAQGFGHLAEPHFEGMAGCEESGVYFQVQLEVSGETIERLAFYCPRCVAAVACGGYLHRALSGQTLEMARQTTAEGLLHALGGLPPRRLVYAWMAVEAIRLALARDDRALKGGCDADGTAG